MEFDESKVITSLHAEKARTGGRYYAADNYIPLKAAVEKGCEYGELILIDPGCTFPFRIKTDTSTTDWQLLYPYETAARPFRTTEEVDAAVKEHGCIVRSRSSGCRYGIREYYVDSDARVVIHGLGMMSAAVCLEEVEFTDGAPFGVEE